MANLLTPEEAATRLGVSVATLNRRVATRELNALRLGPRLVRFEEEEIQRLLEASRKGTPTAEPSGGDGRGQP